MFIDSLTFWINIKFNSVISSSDSLYIPINVLVLFFAFDIVEVNEGEKVDENSDASY